MCPALFGVNTMKKLYMTSPTASLQSSEKVTSTL